MFSTKCKQECKKKYSILYLFSCWTLSLYAISQIFTGKINLFKLIYQFFIGFTINIVTGAIFANFQDLVNFSYTHCLFNWFLGAMSICKYGVIGAPSAMDAIRWSRTRKWLKMLWKKKAHGCFPRFANAKKSTNLRIRNKCRNKKIKIFYI